MTAVLVLTGCSGPTMPDRDSRFVEAGTVPATYEQWYDELAPCVDIDLGYDGILWFWADPDGQDGAFDCRSGRCAGWWQSPNIIVISSAHRANESVVKHEMVHYLTQSGSHDSVLFDRCVP